MTIPIADAGADVTLAFGALPTSQALTGSATWFAPATGITTWAWTLLEKPVGSAASLSSPSVQNPTLNTIDTAGTYRLLLVVTDDNAEISESDLLLAPSSAFVTVSVTSQYAALAKPAPGQRNWNDEYYAVVDEVDAQRQEHDAHVADTADPHQTLSSTGAVGVTNVPAAGEVLIADSGVSATWAPPATAGAAEVGVLGSVQLAEAPVTPASPKAVTQDRVVWSARAEVTIVDVSGTLAWVMGIQVPTTTGPSQFHVDFLTQGEFLDDITLMLSDGGLNAPTTQYRFKIYAGTIANWKAGPGSMTEIGDTLAIAGPATDNAPQSVTVALNYQSATDTVIAVLCTAADATDPGGGLSVTLRGRKKW